MNVRNYWVGLLERIADPVLTNLSQGKLKSKMPLGRDDRYSYTHLEAFGRLLAGIAPWLALPISDCDEGKLRDKYLQLVLESIDSATNPHSADFMNFSHGGQPLVDAAFLAHAILRAPEVLWDSLSPSVQRNLVSALKQTRQIRPFFSNWLLFSAMIEAALSRMTGQYDVMRVDYALRQHEQWYVGDGIYSDGSMFRWDYYNSFVIQPMLIDIVFRFSQIRSDWQCLEEPILKRAKRYAEIQERLISPEGTFPPVGRSLAYRIGAFQLLAQLALHNNLPSSLAPGQVRSALTAVMQRTMDATGTFDDQGWLTIGFCGNQPDIGEGYISTGSVYLAATGLLPLGLSPEAAFWQDPDQDWTAKRLWSGENLPIDRSLDDFRISL